MNAQHMPADAGDCKADVKISNTPSTRWVRVSVEMLEHEALEGEPFDRRSAWLWLITSAAWKDKRVRHQGKMVPLKRGQALAARRALAKTWRWSEKKVRTFLDFLAAEEMIEKGPAKGRFAIVVTICNYDKYQGGTDEKGPAKGQTKASWGPDEGHTVEGIPRIPKGSGSESARARDDADAQEAEPSIVVHLDDHRPTVARILTEEHFATFRELCDTFGRKDGQIIVAPTSRRDSDAILQGLVATTLGDCPQEIATRALDSGLLLARTTTLADRQSGAAGRCRGGIASLTSFLDSALRKKAQTLRKEHLAALAELHTEQVVQTRLAEKRMEAVERSGPKRSWSDLAAEVYGVPEQEVMHG